MEKDVLIHVRGMQVIDSDSDQGPVEIVVPGKYYFRNGNHYLRYEEMFEDFTEPTVNYIKMTPRGMEVQKRGLINMSMIFERGKKNMSYYSTPFGTFQMGIAATALEFSATEEGIHMKVDYALDMNDEHVADCYLTVKAQPKGARGLSL